MCAKQTTITPNNDRHQSLSFSSLIGNSSSKSSSSSSSSSASVSSSSRKRKFPHDRLIAEEEKNHIARELEHEKRLTDVSRMSSYLDNWDSDCSDSNQSSSTATAPARRTHSFSGSLLVSVTGGSASSPCSSPSVSRNTSPALAATVSSVARRSLSSSGEDAAAAVSLGNWSHYRGAFSSPLSAGDPHPHPHPHSAQSPPTAIFFKDAASSSPAAREDLCLDTAVETRQPH